MQTAALASLRHRLRLGAALPFNVRDAQRQMLLARGQWLVDPGQIDALLARGARVDLAELRTAADVAAQAPRTELPRLWRETLDQIAQTLAASRAPTFVEALDAASAPASELLARDADLALFSVLTQGAQIDTAHGARRALRTAVVASLVARLLGWSSAEATKAFKVALTMNLSVLALQGQLARQGEPPRRAQRDQLRAHPMHSVQMLQAAGVQDHDWLQAVLQHHEVEDGSGYPAGRHDVSELASLVRRADTFTSRLAARNPAQALAADAAGRALFMQGPGYPSAQALVAEFGLYAPGCQVRLASGARAVVVGRGATLTAPLVSCLTDGNGLPLAAPRRQASGHAQDAVVALVPASAGCSPVADAAEVRPD